MRGGTRLSSAPRWPVAVVGLLAASVAGPRVSLAQLGSGGGGRSGRYALATGVRGRARGAETLYLLDNADEALVVLEYYARGRKLVLCAVGDLRRHAALLNASRKARVPVAGGRSQRYALVTGLPGVAQGTQTLHIADNANELVVVFEYSAPSHALVPRGVADLRRLGVPLLKGRKPQPHATQGYGQSHVLVTGIPGVAPSTQTLYILDDVSGTLQVFEHNARARKLEPRTAVDLVHCAAEANRRRQRQGPEALERPQAYAVVTGTGGDVPGTETLYIADDANELLFIFEYNARSRKLELRTVADLRLYLARLVQARQGRPAVAR